MEKEIIRTKIDYNLNWAYSIEINEIRKDLDILERLGATHVEIDSAVIYDDSYVRIDAISEHLETDEEFELRISKEKQRELENKNRELKVYEKIKEKYNLK